MNQESDKSSEKTEKPSKFQAPRDIIINPDATMPAICPSDDGACPEHGLKNVKYPISVYGAQKDTNELWRKSGQYPIWKGCERCYRRIFTGSKIRTEGHPTIGED